MRNEIWVFRGRYYLPIAALPQYSGGNCGASGSLSSLRSRFAYAFLVSSLIFSRLTELIFVDAFFIANSLSCRDRVDDFGIRLAAVNEHDEKQDQVPRHTDDLVTLRRHLR